MDSGLLMNTPLDEVFGPYPTVLTVEQVAELLGRDVQDTYRRLQKGLLPFGRKEGGRWLIYKAEVRRYVESLPDVPESPPGRPAESTGERDDPHPSRGHSREHPDPGGM